MDAEFSVRVTPKARKAAIEWTGEGVRMKVTAPPADGQANEAVVAGLAKALGVGKRSVEIVRGQTSREKVVRVSGLSFDEVRQRLENGDDSR